jgi:hypothetical protein
MTFRRFTPFAAAMAVVFALFSAALAQEAPVASTEDAAEADETTLKITVAELAELLKNGDRPRVAVENKFTTLKGTAVKIEKGQIYVDVTGEKVAVAGVLGTPASLVKSIEVIAPLTAEERKKVNEATARYFRSVAQKTGAAPDERIADEPEKPAVEQASSPKESTADAESESAEVPVEKRDMLALYPPSEGWGPDKLFEITRKRIVLGLNPFGKDKTFQEDYEQWRKAYQEKRNEQLEMQAVYQANNEEPPAGFEVWPELKAAPEMEGVPWGDEE